LAHQTGNLGASGVAVKDLYKKGIDGVDGIEKSFAMKVIEVIADCPDYLGRKGFADILLETTDDICDSGRHPWPPQLMKEFWYTFHRPERPWVFITR
jgi:hypothetical protein